MSKTTIATAADVASHYIWLFCGSHGFGYLTAHLNAPHTMENVTAVLVLLEQREDSMSEPVRQGFQALKHALNPAQYEATVTQEATDLRLQLAAANVARTSAENRQNIEKAARINAIRLWARQIDQITELQNQLTREMDRNTELQKQLTQEMDRNTELENCLAAVRNALATKKSKN